MTTLERVKLKDIDDKSPYGYPTKSIEIRTKQGDILTPTRAITSHEYAQKEIAPTDITLDDKVSLFVERFNYGKLEKFLTEDKPFERLSDKLRIQKERAQHSYLNIALLKPTTTKDANKKSSIDILSSKKNREKFYRMTIQLQKLMGYDPISITIPNITISESKSLMKETNKIIEKDNLSSIFFFELGQKFPELLKYAVKDLNQQLIGINYKRYTKAVHSYEAMRSYYDKDVAFLIANTSRQDGYFDDLSTMHYMPFLSNDLFASYVPPQGFGGDQDLTPKERLSSIRLFNKDHLTLEKITDSSFNVDEILKQSGRPNEVTLQDMLMNYEQAGKPNNKLMLSRLRAFTKVHEARVSTEELSIFQKHIKDRSTKDYVEESNKTILKTAVSKIR